jgi:hypothetical protein
MESYPKTPRERSFQRPPLPGFFFAAPAPHRLGTQILVSSSALHTLRNIKSQALQLSQEIRPTFSNIASGWVCDLLCCISPVRSAPREEFVSRPRYSAPTDGLTFQYLAKCIHLFLIHANSQVRVLHDHRRPFCIHCSCSVGYALGWHQTH